MSDADAAQQALMARVAEWDPGELDEPRRFVVFTGRYQDFPRYRTGRPLVAVRTTVGRPKFPITYSLEDGRFLAPYGLLAVADDAEFRKRYRHRLHVKTAPRIRQKFEEIAERRPGHDLVLCCFENVLAGEGCHRRDFAEWWREQTGEKIEELEPGDG